MSDREDYSPEQLNRFQHFLTVPGHTHQLTVERGEVSLKRDGLNATISKEAVEDMGKAAASWVFSRTARAKQAMDYTPMRVGMVLSVALRDEALREGTAEVRRWRVGDDLDEMQDEEGQTCVVEFERPPDTANVSEDELRRLADSALERIDSAACLWIATRIHRGWGEHAPHKVTMAVKALLDGELAEDDEGTVSFTLPDGGHRFMQMKRQYG